MKKLLSGVFFAVPGHCAGLHPAWNGWFWLARSAAGFHASAAGHPNDSSIGSDEQVLAVVVVFPVQTVAGS